ncbi:S-layer homology domain-containing protein [Anaerovorax sp. IOR16]|uniref:S-layer homology domain-containing protein n=1 Tax=Anaerovorax sp. IOR16 TaxID=2773458 RepID=UPI0019D27082|nr:S-layer homology domain-containing protein [Anaerovorax sp. IOR16]
MKVKMRIHRRLAILMALCMVISLMPAMPVMAETVLDTSVWSGSPADSFESGNGETKESPYIIKTAEQLAYLAAQVNSGTDYAGKYFELQNDIVLNGNVLDGAGELNSGTFQSWTPIGYRISTTDGKPFKGDFNGRGHSITGIYINDSSERSIGLFGYTEDAVIENIHIKDNYIYGKGYVGGVAGYKKNGSISNCSNSGAISNSQTTIAQGTGGIAGYNYGGSINDSSNSGIISGVQKIGGVAGWNKGSINNSSNSGAVSGTVQYVGGIVGDNDSGSSVNNSSNNGTVNGKNEVGGVVGYNCGGSISNSSNSGVVSGDGMIGGVAGENRSSGTISNSCNSGEVNGKKQVGGVAGSNGLSKIVSCSNSGAVKHKIEGSEGIADVGGIAGSQAGTTTADIVIENCSNSGSISGAGGNTLYIGGITGSQNNGIIENCSNSGSISGVGANELYIGGLIGQQHSGTIDSCFWRSLTGIAMAGNQGGTINNCGTLDGSSISELNNYANDNSCLTWVLDANSYPRVAISQMQLQWADGCLDDVTYNSSETKSITYKVTNTGNTMLSNVTVNLSGDNKDNFEVNGFNSTGLEPNETAEFTVSLKTGTIVGNYTASVDVSGESIDGEPLQTTGLSFSQKVNKAASKLPEIEKTDETIKDFSDGSLTNVTKEMEYKAGEESAYQAITEDGTLTGLAPGTYYVRYQDSFAANYEGDNTPVSLTINETGVAPIYKLELTANDSFQDLTYGYEKENCVTYTLTNDGNTTVSDLTVVLSGAAKDDFVVSNLNISELKPSGEAIFTITFPLGKTAGSYAASVDVSGKTPPLGAAINTNTSITQQVNKAASKLSEIGKTNETIKGLGDGSLTNVTKEMEYKVGEEGVYQAITEDGTITGLAPDTYYVRYQDSFATNYEGDNTPVQLTIEEPRYELKLEGDSRLPVLTYGYEKGNSVTYTVTNAGNTIDSGLKIALSGDDKDAFEVGKLSATKLAPKATANFTVTLISGKEIGTYTADLKVESNTTSASLTITQQVRKSGGGHSSGGGGSVQTDPATQEENPSQNETLKSLEMVKKDGAEKVKVFNDVKESSWFYEGTVYSLGSGWFAGSTETTFSPSNPMTREMFRIVFGRMGADVNDLMDNDRLKENITREQLVTLLYRMAQEKGLVKADSQDTLKIFTFEDGSQVSSWAKEAMAWANAQDIIKGDDKNMLKPKAGATRAEVAVILMRFDTIVRNN